jgi:uncharacterized protein YabN with tetrapyrrole methylase and pyrophosphatase domain
MDAKKPPVDIYVVGTGTVGYRQLTKEAEAALKKSDKVFLVHHQELISDYLEEFTEVIDITDEYEDNTERSNTYQRMAERVISSAQEPDTDVVSLALYGHPMYFVDPSRIVMTEAPKHNLEVEVLPGISAIDCLYVDIGLDPSEDGLQIFEATDVLIREFELNPEVPTFLLQIGSVESTLYSMEESEPERFTNIKEHLQQFYPDDHPLYLLQTATYPISKSERIQFELSQFDTEEVSERINHMQTLYVPPIESRGVKNSEMQRKAGSVDHLESITVD